MSYLNSSLADVYEKFLQRCVKRGSLVSDEIIRTDRRFWTQLAAHGVNTVGELLQELPQLPDKLKFAGLRFLQLEKPRAAIDVLMQLMEQERYSAFCASILGSTGSPRAMRHLLAIGREELDSASPDVKKLEAVVAGLKLASAPSADELLLTIYERPHLPGRLRGDAADALGCAAPLHDRRTRFFRRALAVAMEGIHHPDIKVEFWSMYVLMQIAARDTARASEQNRCLHLALPRLREIAAHDTRLAPGFWWTMCEEARDAIHAIETGSGPDPDAGERCQNSTKRGPTYKRD